MKKKIKYMRGNAVDALLNGEVDKLLHQCNAQGAFKSGVAGEIRSKIPSAYENYMDMYNSFKIKGYKDIPLGAHSTSESGVINMVSQQYYGRDGKRYTNYGAMSNAFMWIPTIGVASKDILAIPLNMGCGLGGGDWGVVEELIEHMLVPHFKEVRVYEL